VNRVPLPRAWQVWDALQPYFREEIEKGVLGVDASTPASIMPSGGFRMVEAGLEAAGVLALRLFHR